MRRRRGFANDRSPRRQTSTVIVAGLGAALLWLGGATIAQAEVISSFTADITPAADGSFLVTETISYDFETAARHGIFRTLENTHAQKASAWYKERFIGIELLEVSRDGQPEPHEITSEADPFEVRIGDPDRTISGKHIYTLRYRVDGALARYPASGVTELYWNATGHDWPVPILSAAVVVHDQAQLLLPERSCYVGPPGSTDSCTSIVATSSQVTFVAGPLAPGSGMTIAQALDSKLVAAPVLEKTNFWILIIPAIGLWFLGLAYAVYRYVTKYRPNQAVIARYEPFEDFKPMFTGVLFDGRLDPRDITAGLVYLAQQGFITIRKTERKILWLFNTDDYEFTLKKPAETANSQFLQEILSLIFDRSDVGAVETLSHISQSSSRKRTNYYTIQQLKKALVKDLVDSGFYEQVISWPLVTGLLIVILLVCFFVLPVLVEWIGYIAIPIFLVCIGTAGLLLFAYRRRTVKGYEALWHLRGFKNFLSTTEKERYEFHNAPEKSPQLFMEYLPYAIAFGVEEKWAKAFEGITIPEPDWYQGGSAGSFSAVALTNDLGAFSSSFSASSGTASSGGGSSGGGSGGGGGGSW